MAITTDPEGKTGCFDYMLYQWDIARGSYCSDTGMQNYEYMYTVKVMAIGYTFFYWFIARCCTSHCMSKVEVLPYSH